MALSTQDEILIEQRVTNDAKSLGVAYILWLFLGGLGGHRFYLARTGSAIVILCLTVIGFITAVIGVGVVLLLIAGIWVLVDAFLIPGMVQADKDAIRQRLRVDAMSRAG